MGRISADRLMMAVQAKTGGQMPNTQLMSRALWVYGLALILMAMSFHTHS